MIETKENKMIKQALKQEINELSITINGMILLKALINLDQSENINFETTLDYYLFNVFEGLMIFYHDYNDNNLLIRVINKLINDLAYSIGILADYEAIRENNYYYKLLVSNQDNLIKKLV